MNAEPAFVTGCGLHRSFDNGQGRIDALADVSLTLARGEMVAVEGPSGAGKSTLLQLLALLARPDQGTLHLDGMPVHDLPEAERTRLRLQRIGIVTQRIDLIPELDALDNVSVPQILARNSRNAARAAATELLSEFGLGRRLHHYPADLSGGEQQRVAMARALVNGPALVVADEPTGSLDTNTGDHVLGLLHTVARHDVTVIVATHDPRASAHADRTIRLVDGRVVAGTLR